MKPRKNNSPPQTNRGRKEIKPGPTNRARPQKHPDSTPTQRLAAPRLEASRERLRE